MKTIILTIHAALLCSILCQPCSAKHAIKPIKNLTIMHVKQMHQLPHGCDKCSDRVKNKIAQSQYEIANYIKKNPHIPVFLEGLQEDGDFNSLCKNSFGGMVQHLLFPQGLPSTFNELNEMQKSMFISVDAPIVLVCLGLLSKIHKTINPDLAEEIHAQFSAGDQSNILGPREKAAIDSITTATINHPEEFKHKKAILIFGARHDFHNECRKHGYSLKETDFGIGVVDELRKASERLASLESHQQELTDSDIKEIEGYVQLMKEYGVIA